MSKPGYNIRMVDAHCHLNFHAFKKDVLDTIEKAKKAGVTQIVNVGTTLSSSKNAIELAEEHAGLYATVGIHPHHADKLENNWENKFIELAKNPKVVAIGETGIDFFSYESNGITDHNLQKELFSKQIEIAYKLKHPLMIHNRLAGNDILDVIKSSESRLLSSPGLFHCFSGDVEFLKKVLNLGFYVGFDGNISYPGIARGETTSLSELVKYAPIDRIITETDSPFLAPEPYRGSRNEPSYVIIVAELIAKIKNLSKKEVIEKTTHNAHTLFRLGEIL